MAWLADHSWLFIPEVWQTSSRRGKAGREPVCKIIEYQPNQYRMLLYCVFNMGMLNSAISFLWQKIEQQQQMAQY